jgi:FkbM family methyltransferase
MIQKSIFFCGVWEPAISAFIRHSLTAGDTFIDVGANIGFHSCLAARRVGPEGRVHAVEASPRLCNVLQKNVSLNHAHNVRIHNVAVMDVVGTVRLFMGPESALGVSSVTPEAAPDRRRNQDVEVAAQPLHHTIAPETLFAARLIKIDVEGAEWPVFRGIAPQLEHFGEDTEWILEITPASVRALGGTVHEMIATFLRAGFSAYSLENPYDIDWYVRRSRAILDEQPASLVRPLPDNLDTAPQTDVLFSRRRYGHRA